jgi:hypothetical protein
VSDTTSHRLFSGRQITTMVVAGCVALVAAPVAARAATAVFSSSSASTPAVAARNSSAGTGAKAVYGNASAGHGITYGVYGRAGSAHGFGVYAAGRLGTSGALVCSRCVTGGDVNASTLPTVPDAARLGGHARSYYARIVPLSWLGSVGTGDHLLADVDGLSVYAYCQPGGSSTTDAGMTVAADTAAGAGTLNEFRVLSTELAFSNGFPLGTTKQSIGDSNGAVQTEGTAIYRNDATGRIVTINFHLYGSNCEAFGDVVTAG